MLPEQGVQIHVYADDIQILIEWDGVDIGELKQKIKSIFDLVDAWMYIYKLKLNLKKTQLMLFGPKNTIHTSREKFESLVFKNTTLKLMDEVRNLGVWFDYKLEFRSHITKIVRSCNYSLYNLKPLRSLLSDKLFISLIHHEITSKIDYCNSLFLGLPKSQLKRLQKILNNCARLIHSIPFRESVSKILKMDLHWLPIGARIDFKILLIIHQCMVYQSPEYLCDSLILSRSNRLIQSRCETENAKKS